MSNIDELNKIAERGRTAKKEVEASATESTTPGDKVVTAKNDSGGIVITKSTLMITLIIIIIIAIIVYYKYWYIPTPSGKSVSSSNRLSKSTPARGGSGDLTDIIRSSPRNSYPPRSKEAASPRR